MEDIKIYVPVKSSETLEVHSRTISELIIDKDYDKWILERNNFLKKYREMGFSTIPLRDDKTPFVKWSEYQKRKSEADEIYD